MKKRTSFDREEDDVIFFGAPNFNAANVFSPEVVSTGGGSGGGSRYTQSNINSSMFLRRKPAISFNSGFSRRGFPGNDLATGPTGKGAVSALPPFDLGDHDGQQQQQQQQQQRNPTDSMRYVTPSPYT